jgi:sugar phosphate isomerase/epimerase
MGDGVIDFAAIGTWVRDAGYSGDIEVEIFNQQIWDTDGDSVLETITARFADLVLPYA